MWNSQAGIFALVSFLSVSKYASHALRAVSIRLGLIEAKVGVTLLEAPNEHLNTSSKAGFLAAYIKSQTRADALDNKFWPWLKNNV